MTFWRPGSAGRQRLLRGAGLRRPSPPPRAHVPPEIDADAFRSTVEELAESLAESVDEATPDALTNLVNSWADQWIATVEAAHSRHGIESRLAAGRAAARAQLTRDLWLRDLCRLAEIGQAVEAAVTRLAEEEPVDDHG